MSITVAAGLLTGCLAAVYAMVTGHSPADVALSGQATLATLGADPGKWDDRGPKMLLLVCKGLAYGLCLGPPSGRDAPTRRSVARIGRRSGAGFVRTG